MQRMKRKRARRLGLAHYEKLTDGQLTDSWATGLFPNVQIGMHPEGVFIMRFLPHADDPKKFYYDNITMYRSVDDRELHGARLDGPSAGHGRFRRGAAEHRTRTRTQEARSRRGARSGRGAVTAVGAG